jgi:hypothetical protein
MLLKTFVEKPWILIKKDAGVHRGLKEISKPVLFADNLNMHATLHKQKVQAKRRLKKRMFQIFPRKLSVKAKHRFWFLSFPLTQQSHPSLPHLKHLCFTIL